jgi:CubicO group peptidase (beta-lactamase class C family)
VIKGGPAGGGFSTVEDLLRFADALRSGKLVTKETLEILWSPKPELQSPGYGYGFGIEPGPWGKRVGHGGGFPGISAQLDIYLDSGYTAVVLSNLDRGSLAVREKIREVLMRLEQ